MAVEATLRRITTYYTSDEWYLSYATLVEAPGNNTEAALGTARQTDGRSGYVPTPRIHQC